MIGSIVDYRYAPDDPASTIELLAAPATRIISMTITEGGYQIRDPGSVFGLIAEALAEASRPRHRRADDRVVRQHRAQRRGRAAGRRRACRGRWLRTWRAGSPSTPRSRRRWWTASPRPPRPTSSPRWSATSEWPTSGRWSPRRSASWVLEDDFADGRPPLEEAGVLLVDDVSPYEAMKLRLLNAGHQCLCYFAWLCGYRMVHDAARDPLFAEFLLAYFDSEAMPTLRPVPGIDLPAYTRTSDRALRQPRRARHRRAVVRLLVGPHPEVAAPGHPRQPAHRRAHPAGVGDGRQLGPLCRGGRRARRADRRRRQLGGLAGAARAVAADASDRVHREHRRCSGIWLGHPASSRRTAGRWTRCTAAGRGRRWQRCCTATHGVEPMTRGLVIGEALIDIVEMARRRACRRQPAERRRRTGAAGPRRRFPDPHRRRRTRPAHRRLRRGLRRAARSGQLVRGPDADRGGDDRR